mmetsp:Transcript_3018/g.3555  ORF Transcript_3018/g.3555 Transcript_3018/m.3555 type:complete len:155 (+) Transcript_3018:46-510(+)
MSGSNSGYFYLPIEHWSPRYDENFFTVKVKGKEKLTNQPRSIPKVLLGGITKRNHPAVYYRIEVYSQQKMHICLRRYSHFEWLHHRFLSSSSELLSLFPPKTCPCQIQNEEFLQNRQEELKEYILDVLSRPNYAGHDAMHEFLELDSFQEERIM